ncbi:capsular polysaccharide synthesis protein [Butyrivibrio sp. VCB2006]|uniref:capsular polysaccharide synthesis protein n=1 Tax=Butyrivibrio sp. VCB2006 TaxID=1280679 RepID=UPI0004929B75|nr:capsular polysaccharide synthesis protein [Butyrivibrio sp. VCB2006]
MSKSDNKLINRIKDHMLLGTIYDQIMLKVKYNDEKTHFLYGVMAGQKHRMIYYRRYKKKYLKKCTADRPWESLPKKQNNDTVWIMWLQGLENAPEIVQKCIESQKKIMPEKTFVIIDENNYSQYVTLPDFIIRKREQGIITNALFSDIMRLELLNKYGGYWIDASVYMTDDVLLRDIEDLPLFMFSFYYFGFNPEIMELNSWFIHSTTNNNLLCLLQKMLYEYLRDYDYISNYYILHILGSVANDYYQDEYNAIPVVSQVDSHVLATYIYDDFDRKKYDILKKRIGIHKLSIKFDQEKLKKKGTFYDVVINEANY